MKIIHVDGMVTETDTLSDADAHLAEECKKLHELFSKYNRQMCLLADIHNPKSKVSGLSFFHISRPDIPKEEISQKLNHYFQRIDYHIRAMSQNQFFIARQPNENDLGISKPEE